MENAPTIMSALTAAMMNARMAGPHRCEAIAMVAQLPGESHAPTGHQSFRFLYGRELVPPPRRSAEVDHSFYRLTEDANDG